MTIIDRAPTTSSPQVRSVSLFYVLHLPSGCDRVFACFQRTPDATVTAAVYNAVNVQATVMRAYYTVSHSGHVS